MLPKQPNQSLIDGMRCLQTVATQSAAVGVSDVGRELELEPTRVHRLLRTLTHMGFIQQTSGRKYEIGPAIYALTAQSLHASRLIECAVPVLEKLKQETGRVVAMGVLWQRSVSYIYHGGPDTSLENSLGAFGSWDATRSGLGMAILANYSDSELTERYIGRKIPNYEDGLDSLLRAVAKIREQGYAWISIPVIRENHTLALSLKTHPDVSVGVAGPMKRTDLKKLLPLVTSAVSRIDAALPHPITQPPLTKNTLRI